MRTGWNDHRDLAIKLRFRDARQRIGITKRVVHIFRYLQKYKHKAKTGGFNNKTKIYVLQRAPWTKLRGRWQNEENNLLCLKLTRM